MASGDTLLIFTPMMNRPPSSGAALIDERNGHVVLSFSGTADQEAVFAGVMPQNYSAATGVTIDLYVMFPAGTTTGTSRWQAAFERHQASTDDLDSDSFASFQSAGVSAPGTAGQVVVCSIAITAGAQLDSLVAGESFRLKIRRDADGTSGTDDITAVAQLLRVHVKDT